MSGGQQAPAAMQSGRMRRTLSSVFGAMAFRQALFYVAAVVSTGAVVMWLLYAHVSDILTRQIIETVAVEADALADISRLAGASALAGSVADRSRTSDGRIYFLETGDGGKLAGNLDRWPASLARTSPGGTFRYIDPQSTARRERLGAGVAHELGGGMRLLVARDLESQRQFADRVKWLFVIGFGALALAGVVAGTLAGRVALRRISSMTETTDAVMSGDFSGRVPVTGSGDEFDHLSLNLNAMLERIQQLMAGLREVSDNIAHDLKTPLSRLRSRAEAALRETQDPAARDGLTRVIEDADELIKTFNALLLIARLEAGAVEDTTERFDVGALADDVVELYAPVAEEAGLELTGDVAANIELLANRQLVGQAIANMIDNAIKYGKPAAQAAPSVPSAAVSPSQISVRVAHAVGEVSISVADSGPGIPAADRERVVRRFVRLEESRTQPGTGLGLSLVAAVARLHGGRVLLEDNSPGLRVVLVLPCRT